MNPSRTKIISLAFLMLIVAPTAFAADPGAVYPVVADRPVTDDKAGSLLIYNIYTSSTANPVRQNTRFSITNTSTASGVAVHLFFIDGGNCSVADRFICLTENQTATLLASEQDPGITGYIVAYAVNFLGQPLQFNHLVGDEYVKFESGHASALGAEAFAKLNNSNVISSDGTLAGLFLDGLLLSGSYDRAARVVAADNIPSRGDGNDTLFILNRVGGNIFASASTLSALFGILYDDAEQPHSFTTSGSCQLRLILNNNFPRTTPRFDVVIPSGQTGWMKLWATGDFGILGCVINNNTNVGTAAGAFTGGHNLHKLKLTAAGFYVVPIFPPGCSSGPVQF